MKSLNTLQKIGWVLSFLLAAFLIMSATMKLMGGEQVKTMFALNNLEGWHTIIGIGELVSVLLFLYPRTLGLGTVLLSGYFGGAIMFHMSSAVPEMKDFSVTAIMLVVVWIIAFMRGLKLVN
jgi:hypothetical protein